jgi:threonine aldolase
MIGGGLRQAGIMAAAGLVALQSMIERLAEDHSNARILGEGLAELGLDVDLESVQTNMVYIESFPESLSRDKFASNLAYEGVLVGCPGPDRIRMVTHIGITREDIAYALGAASRTHRAAAS